MPTATSFTALGRGNGFRTCITKLDVSEFDHFEALSLNEAMRLYWNLSGGSGSFTSSIALGSESQNYSFTKNLSSSYIVSPEPKGRVCSPSFTNPSSVSKTMTEAELDITDGAGCGGSASLNPGISRMYDGDTDNESNFVGYGFGLYSASASFSHNEGILSGSASINIGSALNGETDSGSNESPVGSGNFNYFEKKASIVSIGGIKFRSFAEASVSTNAAANLSRTVTASGSSASASGSWTSGSFTASGSAGVSAPNIDFYTY